MFMRFVGGGAAALLVASAAHGQILVKKAEPASTPPIPVADMLKPPLVATGDATVNASGAKKGDTLVVVPVRHRISAVLKNDVRFVDLFATSRLHAGEKLYGVVLFSEYGGVPTIVWCAPSSPDAPSVKNLGANGACLSRSPVVDSYAYLKMVRPPLLVRRLGVPGVPTAAPQPIIELSDEAPLEGVVLEYRLYGWNKKEFSLTTWMRHGDFDQHIGWLDLPRQPDGSATLVTLGGEIMFRQADPAAGATAKETLVEVVAPLDDWDAVGPFGKP